MIIEDLRQSWDESPPFGLFRPLYPSVDFVKDWLVLGGGTLLARRSCDEGGEPELVFKGGEDRVLTLLALAYLRPMTARTLDHLRRAAREWGRGEKCLAHIHLALADGLIKAGVPTCDFLKAFDLVSGPNDQLEKYSPDQPRVPQGNGRESGQWTFLDFAVGAAASMAVEAIDVVNWIKSHLSSKPRGYKPFHGWPEGAATVTNSNNPVEDPSSSTGTLVAPQNADYFQIYAAGEAVSRLFLPNIQAPIINSAIGHGGAYDFQRDNATMAFIPAYTNASNYSVGVYMAGAAYSEAATVSIAEAFALVASSNYGSTNQIGWIKRGWEDANAGYWSRD